MKHTNTLRGQNVTAGGTHRYHRDPKSYITILLCVLMVYSVTVSLSYMQYFCGNIIDVR
jgi:hypothetical protein